MKKAVTFTAATVTSAASAQSLEFELSDPVLRAPGDSTLVTVFADPGPADYGIGGVLFDVHASEERWSENMTLIPGSAAPPVALDPGMIMGASVTGILIVQLAPPLGFIPEPGRIPVWSAMFTIADPTPRIIDLSTETARFEVYMFNPARFPPPEIRALTPTEGSARITVTPAPAGLALLGIAGLAGLRRRRPAQEMSR